MLLAHRSLWRLRRGGRPQGEHVKQDHMEVRAHPKCVDRERLCGWMDQAPLIEPSHLWSQRPHDNSPILLSFSLRSDKVLNIKKETHDVITLAMSDFIQ